MTRTGIVRTTILCAFVAQGGIAFGTVYDFSTGAGVNHFAYSNSMPVTPQPPLDNGTPASQVFGSAYTLMATSNDVWYGTGVVETPDTSLVPAMRFVFTVAEPRATITRIDWQWEGAADEDGVQNVWLWNATTGAYVLGGSQADVRVGEGTGDGVVSGTISANASDFVDANNRVTILAHYADPNAGLFTDYVGITVIGQACTVDADCEDALHCNGTETCVGGGCQTGTPVVCNDINFCTTDSCNEQTDSCDFITIDCNDGIFCNGVEACNVNFGCHTTTPVNCDDTNDCTVDTCNESTDACDHAPTDPPAAGALPDPADGAIEVTRTPTVIWTAGPPPAPCVNTFDVYLDTNNPPVTLVASGLTTPGYTSGLLGEGTTYYWQIVTTDCCNTTTGPVWSFTTLGTPIVSASPIAVDFTVSPDSISTVQLTLTNSGNGPTSWTASELPAGVAGAAMPPSDGGKAATAVTPRRQRKTAAAQPNWDIPHAPNTLLVGFKRDAQSNEVLSNARRDAVHAATQSTRVHSYKTIPVDVVRVKPGASPS